MKLSDLIRVKLLTHMNSLRKFLTLEECLFIELLPDSPQDHFDTSVWLKLYIAEEGTERARALAEMNRIVSSSILLTESLSALKRRHANREVSKALFGKLAKQITADTQSIDTMPISDLHLRRAETIVMDTLSGTLDALHIAAALLFQEMTGLHVPFVTADKRQAQSAGEMGLEVVIL